MLQRGVKNLGQDAPSIDQDSFIHRVGGKIQRWATGISEGGAFGAPGAEPRWTPSTKQGIGTAYHTSCQVWFTIADGIVNEVYYPHVDRPNTRDLQFLITDGETFVHEESKDLDHIVEYPEQDALLYRLTNSDRSGRYRIIKEVLCDPHHSVLSGAHPGGDSRRIFAWQIARLCAPCLSLKSEG